MKNNRNETTIEEIIAMCIIGIVIILIQPFISYWCGYFDGWLAMKLVGDPLITSINKTFGSSLSLHDLPRIGGALGWIGGFFKSISTFKKEK